MTPTFDKDKPFVTVGGRLPLSRMQNGHGFNRAGEYLGEYNSQGERIAKAPAKGTGGKSEADMEAERLAAEEQTRLEKEAQEKAAKEQADAEAKAKADADAEAQRLADEKAKAPVEEPYKGVKEKTMKKMIEERGLTYEPDATREALIAILVADDNAK